MHRKASKRRAPGALLSGALAIAAMASACSSHPDGVEAPASGQELFAACVSCHREDGLGNATIGAPPIAGLPVWYVDAQLRKFRTDVRGAHPDDPEGLRMRPMSRQLMSDAEVKAVAEFVGSMARSPAQATLTGGNASAGAAAYATCSACHGPRGEGNQALSAPPLHGQADWYMVAQLKKFKAGIRGANPRDTSGATMRPMAQTLASEQAMLDVVAHVSTFSK